MAAAAMKMVWPKACLSFAEDLIPQQDESEQ
jgi:hypothetical protein